MNKKGDLNWNVIIIGIISVIVLLVVILFFREQMVSIGQWFKNLIGAGTAGIEEIDVSKIVK